MEQVDKYTLRFTKVTIDWFGPAKDLVFVTTNKF